jgi:hypothetical protein
VLMNGGHDADLSVEARVKRAASNLYAHRKKRTTRRAKSGKKDVTGFYVNWRSESFD